MAFGRRQQFFISQVQLACAENQSAAIPGERQSTGSGTHVGSFDGRSVIRVGQPGQQFETGLRTEEYHG